MSFASLEGILNDLETVDPRNAAEYAYALAVLYQQGGNSDRATQLGLKAITLFGLCRMETMEDCAALNVAIEGVVIPDLIHENVVRDRLKLA